MSKVLFGGFLAYPAGLLGISGFVKSAGQIVCHLMHPENVESLAVTLLLDAIRRNLPDGGQIISSKERTSLEHPLFSHLILPKKKL